MEGAKLRFLVGMGAVPEAEELIGKLGTMLDEVLLHKQEAEERLRAEAARAAEAEERARVLEQEIAELRAENERLKRGG